MNNNCQPKLVLTMPKTDNVPSGVQKFYLDLGGAKTQNMDSVVFEIRNKMDDLGSFYDITRAYKDFAPPWWIKNEPNIVDKVTGKPGSIENRWKYLIDRGMMITYRRDYTVRDLYNDLRKEIYNNVDKSWLIADNQVAKDEPNTGLAFFSTAKYAIKIPKTNNPPWWLKSEPSKLNGSSQYRWNWVQDTYPYMTLNSWYIPPRVVTTGEAENIYKDKLKSVHPDWIATETVKSMCVIS